MRPVGARSIGRKTESARQWEGLAKGMGAHREVGSVESRILGAERFPGGQNSDLTNGNHIEAVHKGKTAI